MAGLGLKDQILGWCDEGYDVQVGDRYFIIQLKNPPRIKHYKYNAAAYIHERCDGKALITAVSRYIEQASNT